MPYFFLDDSAYDHPKIVGLTAGAFRLWVTGGMYCARHLTDGLITAPVLQILRATKAQCDELWTAGLWEKVADGGYRMHDYLDYQHSREYHLERRRKDKERKARARQVANRDPGTGQYA